jgi:hypothetical protein
MTTMTKAQMGKTVKASKKVATPAKKTIKPPTPEKIKKAIDKFKYKNLPNPSYEMAQTGSKVVKKATISKKPGTMLIPGMGVPTSAPKQIETKMAKSGTNLKKKK